MPESFLTKKIGGVPGGVIAVGGVVVIGGIWYVRKKNAAAAAAAAAAAPAAGSTAGTATATTPGATSYGYGNGGGIDSSTLAALLASQQNGGSGPTGPAGPTGAAGPAGPSGGVTFNQQLGNGDATGKILDVVGSIVGPGGKYTGYNVSGGAPVYADVNNVWRIGLPGAQIPVGALLATPAANADQINVAGGKVTENLA
jgi:hypothetical protein